MTNHNAGGMEPNGFVNGIPERQISGLADLSAATLVPSKNRIGNGIRDRHVVLGESEDALPVFLWELNGNEAQMAPIGGWDKLPYEIEESTGLGRLLFPKGTRNVYSVFSGVEYRRGERSAIVEAASEYLRRAKTVLGGHDTGFVWGSVAAAIAYDKTGKPRRNQTGQLQREIFVAPPHGPIGNPTEAEVEKWKLDTAEELYLLLQGDDRQQALTLTETFLEQLDQGD